MRAHNEKGEEFGEEQYAAWKRGQPGYWSLPLTVMYVVGFLAGFIVALVLSK
jgi:hypothetical protein